MMDYKVFCFNEYASIFNRGLSEGKKRTDAQRIAINESSINAMRKFPIIEPSEIWKTIYIAHVHQFSGLTDDAIINAVISADNSWKKSSGHAFEQMIKDLCNLSLLEYGLEIMLQRDLSLLMSENRILNEVRDKSWLREQINSSVFDLYLGIKEGDGYLIYGCVQSKTSIRDRVTRDREPSMIAMQAYFMSVAIVLDGAFLKLPKFEKMVNGSSSDYKENGWHGMYVLTNEEIDNDRIHSVDISMSRFIEDAQKGAEFWKTQRQWFDNSWRP